MPLRNPSNIAVYTPYPALQQFANGSFTIKVSGSTTPSGTLTFSGSATLSQTGALTRLYINQTPVPSDIFTPYNAADWLPIPPYGGTGSLATVNIGCSVTGNPSVASIATQSQIGIANNKVTVSLSLTNPYSGTMTLTTTTLTIKYFTFIVTPPFAN